MSHHARPAHVPPDRLPYSLLTALLYQVVTATNLDGVVAQRLWMLLCQAGVERGTLQQVVRQAPAAPSPTAVRKALTVLLGRFSLAEWEERLNAALRARWLPLLLGQTRLTLVGDEVALPYWGRRTGALNEEVRGGSPKQGTAWFFTYVTVCALWRGQRIVLGITRWRAHEPLAFALDRLAKPLLAAGLVADVWLYDRGAGNVAAMGWWQAQGQPFVVAAARRGEKQGVAAILNAAEAEWGWSARQPLPCGQWYTLRPEKSSGLAPLTVWLAIAWEPVSRRRQARRQRGLKRSKVKPGQRWRAVAYFTDGGDWRGRAGAVQAQYRRRQSIESSYRQSHGGRARTTSRDPRLRLILMALSLLMQNEWAWLQRGQTRAPSNGKSALPIGRLKDYQHALLVEGLERLKEPVERWWAGIAWLEWSDERIRLRDAAV